MAQSPSAFLVARRDDGFGDVFPLHSGTRYTLGRAPTNRVVLRDDLCSREHAEVFAVEGGWHVRDLGSLNGTHLNGEPIGRRRPGAAADATLVIPLRRALHDGDELRVCNSLFAVALSGAPGEPVASGAERHRTTLPDDDDGNSDRGRRNGA